jgi:tripartite-type tricarboxylate transporter receptor subunit TctC
MVRNLRTLPALLLALVATASPAQGVIRIVVPFAAGGVQDVLARSFNAELGALIARSVIVENRTGAGGTIGNASVAKALPDGHTLLLAAASHSITGSLYAKLPYHPIDDFTGIAHIGSVDYVLMTSVEVPAKNLNEFITYSKSHPGKLNYASAGNGSATHLSMAYLASLTGLDMVHVPLKSTAEAINEVIAGRAHAVIASNIGALPFARDPRVRMLGVTGSKRSRFLTELPTLAESGAASYEFDSWLGLLGPAGMPKAVVDQLNAAMATLLKDPLILERLARQGIEPRPLSPDAFNALLRADFAKMARVVKISGARID